MLQHTTMNYLRSEYNDSCVCEVPKAFGWTAISIYVTVRTTLSKIWPLSPGTFCRHKIINIAITNGANNAGNMSGI